MDKSSPITPSPMAGVSTIRGMNATPPSDLHRLVLFVDLVNQYDELAVVLPVNQDSFNIGGPPRDPSDRWHRMLRAFALRKFVAPTDQVCIQKVAPALINSLPDDYPSKTEDDIKEFVRSAENPGVVFGDGNGGHVGPREVVRDLLYGLYLHGDYDKWMASAPRVGLVEDMALWQWTLGVEGLVRQLRDLIMERVEEGNLVLPTGDALRRS